MRRKGLINKRDSFSQLKISKNAMAFAKANELTVDQLLEIKGSGRDGQLTLRDVKKLLVE